MDNEFENPNQETAENASGGQPGETSQKVQNAEGTGAPEETANSGFYHYTNPQASQSDSTWTTQNTTSGYTAQSTQNTQSAQSQNTGYNAGAAQQPGSSINGYGGYGYRRPEARSIGYQNSGYNAQNTNPGYGYQNPGYGAQNTGNGYNYAAGTQNGGYQHQNYSGSGNGTKPPKKKNNRALKIVALALACVIVGGGIGGGIAAAVLHSHSEKAEETMAADDENSAIQKNTVQIGGGDDDADTDAAKADSSAEAAADDTETSGSNDTDTAFQKTTIQVNTNEETNALTPKDVYENYVNAVVAISNEGTTTNIFGQTVESASSGSGMIISSDGYILTNDHVVEDATKLTVIMTDGNEYEATVIGADSENDVALIKIDATDLPTVSIGDSDNIAVGQQLCAIGNPLGELTNTLTVGYVSALDREITESSTGATVSMFQTDCAINSGNSGGPIFDMSGNVVGITTAKYSSSGSSSTASIEGIGFCIPINDAMDIVNDFLTYGYVRGRVSLGISCQNISSTVTQYYNLPVGVYVVSVVEGSGAEAAGLQEGDIITSIDGTATETVSTLKSQLKSYSPGDTVELEVYRSGETIKVSVTLDEKTADTSTSSSTDDSQSSDDSQSQDGSQSQQVSPFSQFGFSYGYGNGN